MNVQLFQALMGKLLERHYGIARDFQKMFAEKFGAINCRELLPDDISTPAGHEAVLVVS